MFTTGHAHTKQDGTSPKDLTSTAMPSIQSSGQRARVESSPRTPPTDVANEMASPSATPSLISETAQGIAFLPPHSLRSAWSSPSPCGTHEDLRLESGCFNFYDLFLRRRGRNGSSMPWFIVFIVNVCPSLQQGNVELFNFSKNILLIESFMNTWNAQNIGLRFKQKLAWTRQNSIVISRFAKWLPVFFPHNIARVCVCVNS